ncbi:sequence orphan [Purpureocillium lilacinum]|uniref:Sequence orphan n=1 Tax=Purpureocillium lilacinum TaxID=33203 RepID=A0A179HI88_PURLI|nr:sequence orphan [Purpureocillium lilacinum]OAQ90045.1 sequence orphan [Purpureocillium lilacinum]
MKTSPDDAAAAAAGAAALGAAPSQSALSVMTSRTAPASLASSAKQPLQEKERQKQQWNTKNLPARLAADLASATTAGALIAPIISIIDRSIMENASGRAASLSASLRASLAALLTRPRPVLFSRPTSLVLLLYAGTYLTANALDTFTSAARARPASAVSAGPAKFAASSAANVALCVYKDRQFVRLFGAVSSAASSARPVPLPCYALFTLRDCITIFASFNLPPLLAPRIDQRLSSDLRRHISGLTAAQFLAPAAVQLLSTPLHLLGLDLYNRPSAATGQLPGPSWRDRWAAVRANWLVSAAARVCRIVPAFGVGGVVNTKVRRGLMERLE